MRLDPEASSEVALDQFLYLKNGPEGPQPPSEGPPVSGTMVLSAGGQRQSNKVEVPSGFTGGDGASQVIPGVMTGLQDQARGWEGARWAKKGYLALLVGGGMGPFSPSELPGFPHSLLSPA